MVWGQGVVNVGQAKKRWGRTHRVLIIRKNPSVPFHMRRLGATEVGCALLCHYSLDWVGSLRLNKTPTDNLEFASSEAGAKLEGWEHTGKVTRTERSQSSVKWPARYLTIGG